MKSYFSAAMLVGSLGLLAACGDIEQTSSAQTGGTQVGNERIAAKGDTVIQVVNEESMPNIYGKADIFGRKRPTGTTSLIFVGGNGSSATFVRRDVVIQSEKTTVNSSPIIIPNSQSTSFSGNVGGRSFYGTSNTYGAPIFLPPNTPADMVSGVREISIKVSTKAGSNTIVIGGKTLVVLSASNNQLQYSAQ